MPNQYARPVPLTDGGMSGYLNNIGRSINAKHVIGSPGVDVSHLHDATVISLTPNQLPSFMVMAGDYDFDKEYWPGQVVRTRQDGLYKNQNGTLLDVGTTAYAGYTTIPISVGLFVCVKHVPPSFLRDTFIEGSIAHQFDNLPPRYVEGTRWYSYNVYYPIFPEIPSHYTASVRPISNISVTANDTFWIALPMGAVVKKECLNGTQKIMCSLTVESGSSFNSDYLPYHT